MKIQLLFPPPGDPTRPCLTLPALTAYLRQARIGTVEQRDLGIEAYLYLFDNTRLARAAELLEQRIAVLDQAKEVSGNTVRKYLSISKGLLIEPYLKEHIEETKQILRDPEDFFIPERYIWATKVFRRVHELVSAQFYPTTFSFLEYFDYQPGGKTPNSLESLEIAVDDLEHNVFSEFFRAEVLPGITVEHPDLIGISITFPGQLVPALALSKMIRLASPSSHIVFGGALVSYVAIKPYRLIKLLEWADSLVLFQGEKPLLEMAKRIQSNRDLKGIPGLVLPDQRIDELVIEPTAESRIHLSELPVPDYEGMPLSDYLTPEPVFSLAVTKGCYWGRCAFCTRLDPYQQRSRAQILSDMEKLRKRHGAKGFALVGDVVPTKLMVGLADALIKNWNEPPIWFCDTRFEPYLTKERCQRLYAGGCRGLTIGLESGSQRILDHMKKGIDLECADNNLTNLADAGIAVRLACFTGFPTETRTEAWKTMEFIERHRLHLFTATCGKFVLEERSPCYRNPHAFGITSIEEPKDKNLTFVFSYRTANGMDMEEVEKEWLLIDTRLRKLFPRRLTALSGVHLVLQVDRNGFQFSTAKTDNKLPTKDKVPEITDDLFPLLSTDIVCKAFGWDIEEAIRQKDPPACLKLARGRIILYHGTQDRFSSMSQAVHRLLLGCDGEHTVGTILDQLPTADHMVGRSLLASLAKSGIVTLRTLADM